MHSHRGTRVRARPPPHLPRGRRRAPAAPAALALALVLSHSRVINKTTHFGVHCDLSPLLPPNDPNRMDPPQPQPQPGYISITVAVQPKQPTTNTQPQPSTQRSAHAATQPHTALYHCAQFPRRTEVHGARPTLHQRGSVADDSTTRPVQSTNSPVPPPTRTARATCNEAPTSTRTKQHANARGTTTRLARAPRRTERGEGTGTLRQKLGEQTTTPEAPPQKQSQLSNDAH